MNARRLVNRVPGRTTAAVLVLSLSFVTGIRPSIAVTDAGISADEDKTKVEEVVITGTSIKRINAETALPVQVLKRDDIARTGASTVQELFQQISSASWDRIALLRPALRDANFPNQCRFDNSPFDSLQPARRVPTIRPRSLQPTARTGSLSISSIAILQMACDTRRTPPTPSAASANNFIGGYDLTYGDPRGRFVYANVTYSAR
jgi:hypothetical protein